MIVASQEEQEFLLYAHESCFSFDSETSDELSLLEKEAASSAIDSYLIDNFSIEASRGMDKKIDKVCDNFVAPLHIEGRFEVKCAKVYST